MRGAWLLLAIVAWTAPAEADSGLSIDVGLALSRLSGGQCDSGNGFVSPCGSRWGASLRADAGQVWEPDVEYSFVTRELVGLGHLAPDSSDASLWRRFKTGLFFRAYLGAGVRLRLAPPVYVELSGGVDLQIGDTGTGESGIASGANLGFVPRIGYESERWSVALEAVVVPGAIDEVGLADYEIGLLASRSLGD
jgi:hypothetical protein